MTDESAKVLDSLNRFLAEEEAAQGGPLPAMKPGHRMQFHWPRHSVSAQYNVKPQEFVKSSQWEQSGELFQVLIAETGFGIFGKCEALWAEAKGSTVEQMLVNLAREVEPLFSRQLAISRTLRMSRRYEGKIGDLSPEQLVCLLFCNDRDVAHTAMSEIDSHAVSGPYLPSLVRILRDESHQNRRVAQWCVLDIFEDLPNLCHTKEDRIDALSAVKELMMKATDDYSRTVYKAGDVLGDHIADDDAADILIDVLLNAKSAYGRRSAIHGFIHLCEWLPEQKERVLDTLREAAERDTNSLLREYAAATIDDIQKGGPHGPEPVLPEEAA